MSENGALCSKIVERTSMIMMMMAPIGPAYQWIWTQHDYRNWFGKPTRSTWRDVDYKVARKWKWLRSTSPNSTAKKITSRQHGKIDQSSQGSWWKVMTLRWSKWAIFSLVMTYHSIFTTNEFCELNILSSSEAIFSTRFDVVKSTKAPAFLGCFMTIHYITQLLKCHIRALTANNACYMGQNKNNFNY